MTKNLRTPMAVLGGFSMALVIFGGIACSYNPERQNSDASLVTQPFPLVLIEKDEPSGASASETPETKNGPPTKPSDGKPRDRIAITGSRVKADGRVDSPAASKQQEIALYNNAPQVFGLVQPNLQAPSEPLNTENYSHYVDNPVFSVIENPVSTFSVDVDTGSYANTRRFLNNGQLPPEDAVRVEEMINYFSYNYAAPISPEVPFSFSTELAPAPWQADTLLLQIGIKGFEVPRAERPASNLVFLVDVSGSMKSPDKLDLLKQSLKLLTKQLDSRDRISMVVYAGASGVVLQPTPGDRKGEIIAALSQLSAGGSTNGAAGIKLAYEMAEQAFIQDGINRVMLATDGDFNVGTVNFDQLKDLVERKRDTGIQLTTLGFGTGNYNDHLMEQLADAGNGNYSYIDSLHEARKVLVDEIASTLQVIAGDVKAQIEFNPEVVAEYRLIGYENRVLRREDFNNDKIDAGDIGAGHTVTAIYEIVLNGSEAQQLDALRYGSRVAETPAGDEIGYLKLRYKLPGETSSQLVSQVVKLSDKRELHRSSDDFRFAAAVAAFGQKLRGGLQLGEFGFREIQSMAAGSKGPDPHGYRAEFLRLVAMAESLQFKVSQLD